MMYKSTEIIWPSILRWAAAWYILLFLVLCIPGSIVAGTSEEIVSLLSFVEQSDCTFIRNGKQYKAPEAREHIAKKYAYFKEQISTAEEFIEYSASKSTMTGQPYRVICDGVDMKSADWLLIELNKLRTTDKEGNHDAPDKNPDD